MFDFVAKHKRWLQVFIGLAMIPFAFFGLEAYTRSVGGGQPHNREIGTTRYA